MKINWNKITPKWEVLFHLFPYLLFSLSPIITILFYKPDADLDWFRNIYCQWIEAWPKLNTQFILVILVLTVILLILKAHKTKWLWGWLGFGFLGLGVFTPLLQVDLWRRQPGYVIEVMIWVIIIVTLLLVAMKAYRKKWFWAWLIISPLTLLLPLPALGKWLDEIGKFSFFEKIVRFISEDFLDMFCPYPLWLHMAQLTVFALAVILLIRVVQLQGENVFLFCFGILYGYWLFLIPAMLGRGYATTDTIFLEPMKEFPFYYRAIGVACTLIPLLVMICLLIFLVQKKWQWRLILIAGLVSLQFALIYWPLVAIFLKSPRTPDTYLFFSPLLGSAFLGFLWITIRLYFEIFIARPMTFLTLLLLLLFVCLYLRKVLIRRGSSGKIGDGV